MNKFLPYVGNLGMILILGGVFVTIIVCAVMPHVNDLPYASDSDVWRTWQNREIQLHESVVSTSNMARALAQHADDTFKEADTLLVG